MNFNDVRTFTGDNLRSSETLFPREVDRNPWIWYHATSSINEQQIDAEGLMWTPGICSSAEAHALARVYQAMNWFGVHTGGYVVLQGFSLLGDFQGLSTKPIYFREYSLRPILYAQRDFAGGETARAVRHALNDLHRYLADEALRNDHYDRQRREAISCASMGAVPPRVIRVDIDWLRTQLQELAGLRERCDGCLHSHRHGVIYAVMFKPEDIPALDDSDVMGLRCYVSLPVERLVGKVRVMADEAPDVIGNDSRFFRTNRWRDTAKDGVRAELAKGPRVPREPALPLDISPCQLDPAAGPDESIEIARQYGSPELANFVRQHRAGQLETAT